ncbi:hypothetical protein BDV95DRAFT_84477 [Massariosphaeria phaeospora]|uniref:Nucleolar protein,Nop52-domain-containing protein n=1 Tax=Massariosphaeria phaeospora TaxID=100035 RepID=A0A7C8ICG3_9PLEO|nr:hypothetical protein BDV95DRAFT_84477 [Massariosphaeria phaeospora]
MAADAQNSPFIKNLASSDKRIRDQALESLRVYLGGRSQIPELDLLKLWKGLFYCLWMQDKPLNQQRLARDLASLPSTLQPGVVLPFLSAFWRTIAREWGQIDALRMDKYLFLIRQYVNASWRYLSRDSWGNRAAVQEYAQILAECPLSAADVKVPNGLRYHVLDVFVDELEKVQEKWDGEGNKAVLETLVEPIEKLVTESKVKAVRGAAQECLADDRLRRWRGQEADTNGGIEDHEEEWGGIED